MRFFLGIIVGIAVTIGGAYIHDGWTGPEASPDATAARPMVNWDVVDTNWQRATSRVRSEWDRLAAK